MKFYLQVAILLLFPHLLFCQSVEQEYQELVDDIYLHRYLFDTAYNTILGTRISIDSERSNTTEHWHFSTSFNGVYSNLVSGALTYTIRGFDCIKTPEFSIRKILATDIIRIKCPPEAFGIIPTNTGRALVFYTALRRR